MTSGVATRIQDRLVSRLACGSEPACENEHDTGNQTGLSTPSQSAHGVKALAQQQHRATVTIPSDHDAWNPYLAPKRAKHQMLGTSPLVLSYILPRSIESIGFASLTMNAELA